MSESREITLVSDRERGSVHLMSKRYEVSLVSKIDRVHLMNERLSSKVSVSERKSGSTHLVSKSSESCILLSTKGGVHLVRYRGLLVCV